MVITTANDAKSQQRGHRMSQSEFVSIKVTLRVNFGKDHDDVFSAQIIASDPAQFNLTFFLLNKCLII